MKELVFVVPGDLNTPTGGYVYDRRIAGELAEHGWSARVLDLGEGFPHPSPGTRAAARGALARLPYGQPVVIDGLAYGVLAEEALALCELYRLVALVHHPLALEPGLDPAEVVALRESERAALACARAVIATSASTARLLAFDYGVPPERINVVRPGTDRVPPLPHAGSGEVTILAVGAVVRRKGYDVLVAALARLAELPWHLVIVGARGRSPETAQSLDADIVRLGLSGRVRFTGAVSAEALATLYGTADIFALPSRFEGYGMAFSEAIAYGIPVIGTNAAAISEAVPAGAGILVPPDDVESLAAALRRLILDPAERAALAARSRAAAALLPTWSEAARLFAQVLDRLP